jgi:hypothetical protein
MEEEGKEESTHGYWSQRSSSHILRQLRPSRKINDHFVGVNEVYVQSGCEYKEDVDEESIK